MKKIFIPALLLIVLALSAGRTAKYEVGDNVADFKLKNTDGKFVSLSDYADKKGVVVIFDCNTCPYSQAYNDRIINLHKKYAPQGFPVIAINANSPDLSPGDSFEQMVNQAKRKKYEFPYLVDESQEVARSFGATNTPHVFVLAKKDAGFVVAYIGAIDNNTRDAGAADKKYVEDAIGSLLTNKAIPTTKTKAIGCGIKWKDA